MGLVSHRALVNNGAPFVNAFGTIFPHGAWADRNDTAWFGVVAAAALPSLLMLWRYTASSGLTVFTYLVDLTVVTVAIPYLFSACAQLTYLVSRRRPLQGWLLARDLSVAVAAALFSLWVTFAAGYSAVYQAMVVVLAGIILYAFVRARREHLGQIPAPTDLTGGAGGSSPRKPAEPNARGDPRREPGGTVMSFSVQSEVGQLRLRELFEDLDGLRLAEYLVGGVLKADLRPLRAKSLKSAWGSGPRRWRRKSCPAPYSPAARPTP
jgi:hypothetical protein